MTAAARLLRLEALILAAQQNLNNSLARVMWASREAA